LDQQRKGCPQNLPARKGPKLEPERAIVDRDPHTITLDELELSMRARNILLFAECKTLADILLFGRRRLGQVPNCGPTTIRDIAHAVSRFGYGI